MTDTAAPAGSAPASQQQQLPLGGGGGGGDAPRTAGAWLNQAPAQPPAQTPQQSPADGSPSTPQEPPAGATEQRVRIGAFEAEARGLAERAALEQSRRATLPADANGYKLELPKDFQIPQGVEFKLDPNSEAARLARDFAHEAGLSQEQFSKLVSIYAAERVAEPICASRKSTSSASRARRA